MSPLLEQAIAGLIGALTVALLAYIQHKQAQWAKETANKEDDSPVETPKRRTRRLAADPDGDE